MEQELKYEKINMNRNYNFNLVTDGEILLYSHVHITQVSTLFLNVRESNLAKDLDLFAYCSVVLAVKGKSCSSNDLIPLARLQCPYMAPLSHRSP